MSNQLIDSYLNTIQFDYELLFESDYLTEGKVQQIINHITNRLDIAKKHLGKFGINTKEISNKGKKFIIKEAHKLYEQGFTAKKAAKALMKKIISIILPYLKKAVKKFKAMDIKAKVAISLLLAIAAICLIIFLNSVGLELLRQAGLGLWDAMRVMAIAIGPALEEAMKTFFISIGLPFVGTALFVGMETVFQGITMVKDLSKMPMHILMYLPTAVMHFLTVWLQKDIHEKSKAKQESTAKRLFKMWVAGFVMHAFFNAIAIFRNEDMYRGIFDPGSWQWILNAVTGRAVAF